MIVASLWMLILLPPLLIVMQLGVIKREEAYLREKFGQPYIDYCARVRRWV
jgi:protein-S-isoprenylcysteine O-methyltransferase Ste14